MLLLPICSLVTLLCPKVGMRSANVTRLLRVGSWLETAMKKRQKFALLVHWKPSQDCSPHCIWTVSESCQLASLLYIRTSLPAATFLLWLLREAPEELEDKNTHCSECVADCTFEPAGEILVFFLKLRNTTVASDWRRTGGLDCEVSQHQYQKRQNVESEVVLKVKIPSVNSDLSSLKVVLSFNRSVSIRLFAFQSNHQLPPANTGLKILMTQLLPLQYRKEGEHALISSLKKICFICKGSSEVICSVKILFIISSQ